MIPVDATYQGGLVGGDNKSECTQPAPLRIRCRNLRAQRCVPSAHLLYLSRRPHYGPEPVAKPQPRRRFLLVDLLDMGSRPEAAESGWALIRL
jgi:hypothetical protein